MKINAKNLFSRLLTRKQHVQSLARDWKMIAAAFLVLNAAVVIGSLYAFWSVSSTDESPEPQRQMRLDKVSAKQYEGLIKLFEDRKKDFDSLRKAKPSVVDPSI